MSNTLHLYFCSNCDKFVTKIVATVARKLTLYADSEAISCNRFFSLNDHDDDEGDTRIRCEEFVGEPICPWCYNPIAKMTILKQNCPHDWETNYGFGRTTKKCLLCGERKEGRVVFDE